MFSDKDLETSGKHMICDIREIKNTALLQNPEKIREVLTQLCEKQQYSILGKLEHVFEPEGCTMIFLLSESHLSVHTFPERNYIAFDLYTCRCYHNNSVYMGIYKHLIQAFDAKLEQPIIIDRYFDNFIEREGS